MLDGSNARDDFMAGLEIHSGNNLILGLQIVNFKQGVGIMLVDEAKQNIIGGDRSIGVGPIGQGNMLSGNDTGIVLTGEGVTGNVVTGNLIGTDSSGDNPFVNEVAIDGVGIRDGASNNTIGPGNTIAYHRAIGVLVNGKTTINNTITRYR